MGVIPAILGTFLIIDLPLRKNSSVFALLFFPQYYVATITSLISEQSLLHFRSFKQTLLYDPHLIVIDNCLNLWCLEDCEGNELTMS